MVKARFIERLKKRMFARGHMSWILIGTVACGIIASKLLLFSGLSVPMYRYSLAILFSYGMFFLFIYLWLRWTFGSRQDQTNDHVSNALDAVDVVNVPPMNFETEEAWTGSGGQFSGGGASGQWGSNSESAAIPNPSSSSKSSSGFDPGDLDEAAVLIALIALIAAVSGSAFYLIYQAPEILFEAAFEVALAAGLIKKTKEIQAEGWAYPIFRKTWLPFMIVFIAAAGFGYFIKATCPEAASYAQYRASCTFK